MPNPRPIHRRPAPARPSCPGRRPSVQLFLPCFAPVLGLCWPGMKADLHFHSRYSDGCLWPSELAERAARAGLEAAALTDHDTFGGWPEFRQAAERRGLATWPAVEIDCVDKDLDSLLSG
ncbi:MAG: PHP domain-containing protein [Spirochaetia bacterium]|nr:PHP domain-containing protein [Spirochaetia bacterium]